MTMYYKKYLNDFLYLTCFDDLDYKNAFQKFKQYKLPACSAIHAGRFVGRNLDWKYDENVEAIVQTKAGPNRYATIGVAHLVGSMTKDNFKNGTLDEELYSLIPFYVTDCINEHIYCSMNVVPVGDKSQTTPIGQGPEICQMMLPRLICDFAGSIEEAINLLGHYTIFAPLNKAESEIHLLISDGTNDVIIEFVDGEIQVLEDQPIITNFYHTGWDGTIASKVLGYTDEEIEASGLTDHAMGLERYLYLADHIDSIETFDDMLDAMKGVQYTKSYYPGTSPFWYSEFYSNYETLGDLTVYSDVTDMMPIINYVIEEFNNRKRDGKTWITTHTSIYDLVDKKLTVYNQENYNQPYEFYLKDFPRYGVENLDLAFTGFKSV